MGQYFSLYRILKERAVTEVTRRLQFLLQYISYYSILTIPLKPLETLTLSNRTPKKLVHHQFATSTVTLQKPFILLKTLNRKLITYPIGWILFLRWLGIHLPALFPRCYEEHKSVQETLQPLYIGCTKGYLFLASSFFIYNWWPFTNGDFLDLVWAIHRLQRLAISHCK